MYSRMAVFAAAGHRHRIRHRANTAGRSRIQRVHAALPCHHHRHHPRRFPHRWRLAAGGSDRMHNAMRKWSPREPWLGTQGAVQAGWGQQKQHSCAAWAQHQHPAAMRHMLGHQWAYAAQAGCRWLACACAGSRQSGAARMGCTQPGSPGSSDCGPCSTGHSLLQHAVKRSLLCCSSPGRPLDLISPLRRVHTQRPTHAAW